MMSSILRARFPARSPTPNRFSPTAATPARVIASRTTAIGPHGTRRLRRACMGRRPPGGQAPMTREPGRLRRPPGTTVRPSGAAAAAGQLARRDVDRPTADRHGGPGPMRRDRLLHGDPHGRHLLGRIELDGDDVVVALEPGQRLLELLVALESGQLAGRQGSLALHGLQFLDLRAADSHLAGQLLGHACRHGHADDDTIRTRFERYRVASDTPSIHSSNSRRPAATRHLRVATGTDVGRERAEMVPSGSAEGVPEPGMALYASAKPAHEHRRGR